MSKSVFYSLMTILYVLWMFVTLIVAIRRDGLEDTEMNDNLMPYLHTDKATRIVLLVWAAYTLQMTILMIYDMISRG